MSKFSELQGLNLNGFKPYFKQSILVNGKQTTLYFLGKQAGKMYVNVRAVLSDLEFLIEKGLTDTNTYHTIYGELADKG